LKYYKLSYRAEKSARFFFVGADIIARVMIIIYHVGDAALDIPKYPQFDGYNCLIFLK